MKSKDGILATLDAQRQHKGLAFSRNMIEERGKRMQVLRRVETIVEERTGWFRTVCGTVLLEGSICDRYLGCARGMPFLWREIWLRRIDMPLLSGLAR